MTTYIVASWTAGPRTWTRHVAHLVDREGDAKALCRTRLPGAHQVRPDFGGRALYAVEYEETEYPRLTCQACYRRVA